MVSMPRAIATFGEVRLTSLAGEEDAPERRLVGAGQDLDQGRLAGAVVADQADDLAGLGVEIDAGQRVDAAVPLLQRLAADERVRRRL